MGPTWRPAYVALGSNLDGPRDQVAGALARLRALPSCHLVAASRLYLSQPLGPQNQPEYVNAAAGLLTQLGARELLERLLEIEREMGRVRAIRWGPRRIDLDLLWIVGEPIEEPGLVLPHPGVSMRNFVLYPLADIAPTLDVPNHGRVSELKARSDAAGICVLETRLGAPT